MTEGLNKTCTFQGVKYYGRFVYNKKEDEHLLCFEEALGDVLSPYICGIKDCDEITKKEVIDIDDKIFAYLPIEVLQNPDDEEVIKWGLEHSIDF